MGNPLQDALNDAFAELSVNGSLTFTFATAPFQAWPTEHPREVASQLLGSPDQIHWYETKSAPVFKKGQSLDGADGKSYTVAQRLQADPFTGVFKFAILPGRSA